MLMLLMLVSCLTTTIPEFEQDAPRACAAELVKTVEVSGRYPGDVTLTMTYDFDYAEKGPMQVANTYQAVLAYKAAIAANGGIRQLHPRIEGFTLIMRDTKRELCRFEFDPMIYSAPKRATCAAWVGK